MKAGEDMPFKRIIPILCIVLGSVAYTSPAAAAEPASLSARTDGEVDSLEQAGRYLDLRNYIERRLANGVEPTATPLAYLCVAYGKLKQYTQLFGCLARLDRRIEQSDTKIQPLNNLRYNAPGEARPLADTLRAEALLELGDYRRTMATGEKAYAAIPKSSFSYSPPFPPVKLKLTILPTLVISAVQAGDPDRAKRFLAQLEAVDMPFGGSGIWTALKSNGLGRAYMALGSYDKAITELSSFRRSTLVGPLGDLFGGWAAKGDSWTTGYELSRRFMLGKAFVETGKIAEAKSALDEILAAPRIQDVGDLYWLALFERGRIAEIEKEHAKATELYRKAVEVVEQQRSSISTEASKIGFVGDKQALYARLVTVLIAQGQLAEAFDYVERSKSRALVDLLATKQDFAAHGDPTAVRTLLAKLDTADLGSRTDMALQSEGDSSRRTLAVARQRLRSAAPELSTLVTVNSVPPEELRVLIRPDETLVEYYYRDGTLLAFVLNRAELKAVKLDGNGLVEQVQAFRKSIENPQSNEWSESSRALYARLWQPLESQITARNVIVVAHGVLHYLPFAALQRPDGGFLADRYSLRLLPSASVLKYLKPTLARKQAPVLAFGNPDLGDPRLSLQYAEGEARTVAGLYPASRLFTRKDASETVFKRTAASYLRIHFATHGKFQADTPLDSGLYLAGDATNDGVLTVSELYSMNINADLVTLSACETGLGKIANGDDVVGLTRGFLYAGSRSIVASLWSVDDKATAALMRDFYKNLAALEKAEALRQAQIKTRQTYPHPYYWAAFQLTGRSN